MDARSAPERVGEAHLADQLPNFDRHLGPARSSSRIHCQNRRKPARRQRTRVAGSIVRHPEHAARSDRSR